MSEMLIFLAKNKAMCGFLLEKISVKLILEEIIYIIKAFIFLSYAALANFFFIIKSTYLVFDTTLTVT